MVQNEPSLMPVRFMTLDPGHFHAALVQKTMYPDVATQVDVYAPPGPDVTDHVKRVAAFNNRRDKPTTWELEVHTSSDFLERMLRERPGTVVILSGRNREKMRRIQASVAAGLHVLADKPWVLKSADVPALESTLAEADASGVVAYDIMTERFEITNVLQRAFVSDEATFGEIVRGTEADPAVRMESVHYLKKLVSGAPNIRPPWFFDTAEQGEGLNDVGTHLVDLVQWTLFPERALDYRADVDVLAAERWPTWIGEAEFRTVTNAPGFPDSLRASVTDGRLEFYCNTRVSYALRGIPIRLTVIWDWEAKPGEGDSHFALYRGTRSRVEVRTTQVPEIYVVPASADLKPKVLQAVRDKVKALQAEFAGIDVEDRGAELRITIPDAFRVGHEAHFAQVTRTFLDYVRDRTSLPAWERPNMLSKYFLTTKATEVSRVTASPGAPRAVR